MITDLLPILGALLVGLIAIFNDKLKEKYGSKFTVLLIVILIASTVWSVKTLLANKDAISNETAQKKHDSSNMAHHFDTIISGLRADTTKLNHTNKLLMDTRDTLSSKLSNTTIDLAGKITKSGKNLLDSLNELNNQITGGQSFVFFEWEIDGRKHYHGIVVNKFRYRVEMISMQVTDYDKLIACKHENSFDVYKIDKSCWKKNTTFFPDTASSPLPIEVSPLGLSLEDFYMPKVVGFHRYEISFTLKNRSYIEQFIYYLTPDFKIAQACRLIEPNGKTYKTFYLEKSHDESFNKIKWDDYFPIPYNNRLYYNLN